MKYRDWQITALERLTPPPKGAVVQAVMGAGKSIVIAEMCRRLARADYEIVVTCPTQMLVTQLADTIASHAPVTVGQFYADEKRVAPITVVCHASLAQFEEARAAYYNDIPTPERRAWIADECHQTECDTVLNWRKAVTLDAWIGFTATPWRAEARESISSFDEMVMEYTAADAVRDGVVVKPTIQHAELGDADEASIQWMREQARQGRYRIVANARDIADCEEFAQKLRDASIPVISVHSESIYGYDDARAAIRDATAVVCYVDMLAEGFDAPEIECMVLRRPVGSRVRFAQEVGRGLRSAPGKTTCYQLDVHDLYSMHSIDWRAALGEVDTEVIPALQLGLMVERAGSAPTSWGIDERMPASVLGPLRSWLRAERVRAQFEGRASLRVESTHWRSDPPSRKQLRMIHDLMSGIDKEALGDSAPHVWAAFCAVRDAVSRDPQDLDGAVRKGDASDLITILRGVR